MSKKWFWMRALVTLVIIGLLVVGGLALYRAGWSQGYVAGQLAVEGGEGAMAPPSFGYPGRFFGFMPYHPFGASPLLLIPLALLFFAVIGKLIRFVIWGTVWRPAMAGPRPMHWRRFHRHWRHGPPPHGPMPPWCWDWEELSEEQTEGVEPEADTGKAGA